MMQHVFRYRRKTAAGKMVKATTYTGRFKLDGDIKYREVSLHCRDEQVARQKLRKIVLQTEREQVGLAVSVAHKECVALSLSELVEQFIGEKERINRSENYLRPLTCRLHILAKECGWKTLRDVSAQSFLKWRGGRQDSPKTLNEYLNALRGFLHCIGKRYALPTSAALDGVEPIDGRGQETFERRALTLQEAQRLLDVAPPSRRLAYILALSTGLRRAELDSLLWGDVHLDEDTPFLRVRAKFTKNRKDAPIPLIAQTSEILRSVRPANVVGDVAVLPNGVPRNRRALRRDMEAAGIPVLENGRKFDFHALRTTACTFLLAAGVPVRIVQEIMRHSDIRLTTKNYADMSRSPIRESMNELAPLVSSAGAENCTSICTLDQGATRHFVASGVNVPEKEKPAKHPVNVGDFADCHAMCCDVAAGKMVEAEGFEPTTH